jgi:hypothetical protein
MISHFIYPPSNLVNICIRILFFYLKARSEKMLNCYFHYHDIKSTMNILFRNKFRKLVEDQNSFKCKAINFNKKVETD